MKSRLTWQDLDLFNEQLLAITKSGLPLAPSLKALARDIGSRRLRTVLDQIRERIERGNSLEESLPEEFPSFYRSIIRAGERTGNLAGVLSHLCAYSARMVEIRNSVQEVLVYPVLVLVACCGVLAVLLIQVVPQFAAVFSDFGGRLPWLTRFWLDVSRSLQANFLAVGIGVVAVLVAAWWILHGIFQTVSGGYGLDRFKMALGALGRLYATSSMARFSRSLGLLLLSDVPILESLDLAAAASGNAVVRRAVNAAARSVQRGTRLSDALKETGQFSHSYCWLLSTAEERGEVPGALLDIADTLERTVSRLSFTVLRLAAPITVLIVGLVVGSVVLSLYLPIFSLADVMAG